MKTSLNSVIKSNIVKALLQQVANKLGYKTKPFLKENINIFF